MDDFELGEAGGELLALNKELNDLKAENEKLRKVIKDNDLEEDLEGIDCTSIEEQICIKGIRYIADLVESHDFDEKDIKNFDTLYKTLRVIRGQSAAPKKGKAASVTDLLKIVEGKK